MIDDQLLVGIVLIAAGVAIGLLAYALVLNRREGGQDGEAEAELPSKLEGTIETEVEEPGEGQAEQVLVEGQVEELPEAVELEEAAELSQEAGTDEAVRPAEEPLSVSPPGLVSGANDEARPVPAGRRAIATLMRDNRTGKLTLVVGDREYVNPSELKGTNDWFGVEEASRDLVDWLSDAQPPEARGKRTPPRAKSLVDEVNEILEQKLAESGLTHRGVRLSEDRDGSVRVYVGLQAYTLDEVPDPEVREVIRQAVAEWEGRK
jgi:hypothetical protein